MRIRTVVAGGMLAFTAMATLAPAASAAEPPPNCPADTRAVYIPRAGMWAPAHWECHPNSWYRANGSINSGGGE